MTMTQKILAKHAGMKEVHAGELIMAKLDLVLGNDITTPVAIGEFPKFGKKKIYAVTLDRDLDETDEATVREGIVLDDEKIVPDALEFPKEDRRHIGLEIHSGQNRVVRRIFEKVGYKVMQLDRVSFAGLTKKNVARGKYRFLTPKEVSMLQMGAFE